MKDFQKRLFDIAVAMFGLVFLAFLFLAIGVLVIVSSPGPVFFKQRRVGRGGFSFTCVKFRTMYLDSDRHGSVTTSEDDRVTPLGRILRRFKLDEFPQLWNVITGQMSFVGPRPDVPGYTDKLRGKERCVLDLRPGITGPATIAFRNEEKILAAVPDAKEFNDTVIYPLKVRLNMMYIDQYRFWKDIGYIVATVLPSFSQKIGLTRSLEIFTIESPEMAESCLVEMNRVNKMSR
jgi:lipopolysaccharide/colanic/teichoic acid biosynthesis glycosyltransferase